MSIKKILRSKQKPAVLLLLVGLWSVAVGWGVGRAAEIPAAGTVDPIPESFQLGAELYLENCAGCHVALPPEVMPSETWRQLLQDPQHYGVVLNLPVNPPRVIIWNYLRAFSRPHAKDEEVPYRLAKSRYFKALHPRVKLPQTNLIGSCVTCHPGAGQYNFRSLAPEWQNSP
jgi:hypothetical protein